MTKKLLILTLILMLTFTTISFAEKETVNVSIPEFEVSVNDTKILTEKSQYPVLVYKNITYFPMTSDYIKGLGLSLSFSNSDGLKINKSDAKGVFTQSFLGADNKLGSTDTAVLVPFKVEVNNNIINNDEEEYPVLLYKNITYFPMTWRFAVTEFGWKTLWSNQSGFGIVSDGSTTSVVPKKYRMSTTEIGELAESVVKVVVYLLDGSSVSGSGFYFNSNGDIITNYHVVENASSIEIIDDNGVIYNGDITIKGYSIEEDIAVIHTTNTNHTYLKLGDSNILKIGNDIYAIGSPLGLKNTLSNGIISSIRDEGLQITAAISSGSSGGALLNEYGEVVGVTYAGYVNGENLGLAIPIDKIKYLPKDKSLTLEEFYLEVNGTRSQTEDGRITYENGDYYIGSIENGMFNGYGEYYWIDGSSYLGDWSDDYFHGVGSMTWVDGSNYFGEWSYDNRDGLGEMYWSGGDHYLGDWVDDHISGYGEYTWSDGESYKGYYLNGKSNGYGVYNWLSGDSHEGYWLNGEKHGYGTYTYSDGSSVTGTWSYDQFVSETDYSNSSDIVGPLYLFSDEYDPVYLGELTTNTLNFDSIFNQYGIYGSSSSLTSIWNVYGVYGSTNSIYSPFNDYSYSPPLIVDGNGDIVGRLTTNSDVIGAISPYEISEVLEILGF